MYCSITVYPINTYNYYLLTKKFRMFKETDVLTTLFDHYTLYTCIELAYCTPQICTIYFVFKC
jgi:hypothetical protein